MNTNTILNDRKIKKSLLNLRYLAYIFLIVVSILGFGATSFYAYYLYTVKQAKLFAMILWTVIFYIVTFLIIWGIKDVLNLLKNLEEGNIFTRENAKILRAIDKKLVFTLLFSIIVNTIMVIAGLHYLTLLVIWIIFTCFILAGHILVNPLALLVEKSAEMRLEMDLTI